MEFPLNREKTANKNHRRMMNKISVKKRVHCKMKRSFRVAPILAEKLNQDHGCTFDLGLFDLSQYDMVSYPQLSLGSQGKMETAGYVEELDDFDFFCPKFPVSLHLEIPNSGIAKSGDFDILIDKNELNYGDVYSKNAYEAWLYANKDFIQIRNSHGACQKKILVLKDSFANAVNPYLALQCQQLDIIDLRYFQGSLRTYLRQNPYDTVVLLMCNAGIGHGKNSLWDFQ